MTFISTASALRWEKTQQDMGAAYLASAFFRSASAASTTSETSWPATAALSMVRLATQKEHVAPLQHACSRRLTSQQLY